MTDSASTRAPRNPLRPLDAIRAVRALLRDPDDTSQVFRVIDALSGNTFERVHRRFRATETGTRVLAEQRDLLDRLSDRIALEALPPGTLGHTYARFMGEEDLSADGLVEASEVTGLRHDEDADRKRFGDRLRDSHDLWHVVTGYGRDILGEVALLAFTFAQTRNPGIALIVIAALAKLRQDAHARKVVWDAFQRGRRAQWLPAADWETLLELPLHEVRERLAVGAPREYDASLRSDGAPVAA